MKLTVQKSEVRGVVQAPPSKSHLHRLLTAAALARGECFVRAGEPSEDILRTADCLTALGARVERTEDGFLVRPAGEIVRGAVLDAGESGTTLRFMLPVSCALGADARLTGRGRLPSRPLGGLLGTLGAAGIEFSSDRLPLRATGRLVPGGYRVDASVSSQYVSGMLLALGSLDGVSTLTAEGRQVSRGYIDMTLEVMRLFGARAEEKDGVFTVGGGYVSPGETAAEGDWSGAAFMLAAGALAGDVTVTGLDPESRQRDRAIADILREMGCDMTFTEAGCRAVKSRLRGVRTDVTDIPDLAPVLSVLMAAAEGESVMTGVLRLRDKESDRLSAIIKNLEAMGVTVRAAGDSLTICGGGIRGGFEAEGFADHRMVMSAAVAALAAGGSVTDAEAVAKSYPAFVKDLAATGGKVYETL